MPSAAAREMEETPVGWVFEVIEARHYAHAKSVMDAHDAARTPSDKRPSGGMFDLALEIQIEKWKEAQARE